MKKIIILLLLQAIATFNQQHFDTHSKKYNPQEWTITIDETTYQIEEDYSISITEK